MLRVKTFEYNGQQENAFHGIIHELTKEFGGNVDDKGIVKVTSSSPLNGVYYPKNAVDLDNCKQYFCSQNIANTWLQYDFQKQKVCPTHYSIRSRHDDGKNGHHPKSWVIEGSNDNSKWTILDSQTDSPFLNDRSAVHTFEIKNAEKNREGFRYLRIRYTGPNWYNHNYMVISALEYFGSLIKE